MGAEVNAERIALQAKFDQSVAETAEMLDNLVNYYIEVVEDGVLPLDHAMLIMNNAAADTPHRVLTQLLSLAARRLAEQKMGK